MELVQLASAGEAGDHVGGAAVDDVAVAGPDATQLARLQHGLLSTLGLGVQHVLAVPLRALLGALQAARRLPLGRGVRGQVAVGLVRGEDDGVRHGPQAVGHVDAIILVFVFGASRVGAAGWDVWD